MPPSSQTYLQGALDLLVLRTLRLSPLHGYGIAQAINLASESTLHIEAGSLYPSLQRLELQGLVTAKWEMSERNRPIRVYRLTSAGRKRLAKEISRWEQFSRSVALILNPKSVEE
jgi:PadR family transcriptional regulator